MLRAITLPIAVIVVCVLLLPAAHAQVQLNVNTSPASGVAGVNFVKIVGSEYPTGQGTFPPGNEMISFSLTCGGAVVATANPTSIVAIIGSTQRSHVLLPASLATGTYYVKVSGTTSNGASYSSTDCSSVSVTHTNPTLAACVPTSSLGIIAPVNGPAQVKALVPNGAWSSSGTGIQVVQLETGGGPTVAPISIPTPSSVNSCAGNPTTGEGVCVANNTDVYHLSPSFVSTTLHSGSNMSASFSGGSCQNCGVAVKSADEPSSYCHGARRRKRYRAADAGSRN